MPKKILFFGDFGIDDVIALLYARMEPSIEIVGLVTGYGNISEHNAENNALFLRALTKAESSIDIIRGAYKPYTGAFPIYPKDIHGEFGLGPLSPYSSDIQNKRIHEYSKAVDIIKRYRNELTIVNVGRLSSLSSMFVLYPEIAEMIEDIYVMGGAFHTPGNVTPVAEANIYGDPYAANLVFTVRKKVKIIPLNVTNFAILTSNMIHTIKDFCKDPMIGSVLVEIFDYYYTYYQKSNATHSQTGAPIHDLLVLWAALHPGSISYIEAPVTVVVEKGEAYGQTIVDLRLGNKKEDYPLQHIAMKFDYEAFINSIMKAFIESNQ
ncbi:MULTISPECIES: nucleoside hydrolase [Pontibacillus]|uniref:Nucleoside hydrolase n=1 Tax=Pontibacillus chungwhensis TaxID=265426 RepID=A0ABY8V2A9_9BACI|nr:nucleoside hydrolase [Pontibacillus chungwhensis]MCD5322817.1 nucleoside hydrolase [Pontibacillus sp. HN14]WIG00087.1 nucleoside hydrolase [Pontibacillus chungwhensis]